ncbi:MAG: radical SAM protein [Candidatus Aenigmatarchaeota archaeon]
MKVLFLNPPFKFKISRESRWPEQTKSGTLYYPFWLSYATGVCMQAHDVMLIDAIAKELSFPETIKKIKSFNPDLIVAETSTPTFKSDLKFLEKVKAEIEVKIALVGTHASVFPEEALKSKGIDFVARKEFDYTILDLANTLEKNEDLKKVLGLSFKKGKKIIHNPDRPFITDLDSLPFVSQVYKKFLDVRDYRYALALHPMIQILSSRGCPNLCCFCDWPQTFMSRLYRTRSPENFVDELEFIANEMPEIKEIFIEDDTFSILKDRVVKICDLIKERKLDITWSANVRADIPFYVLKKMKDAGCRILIVGYESGSNEILKNIKKGITVEQAERFTEAAKNAGLKIFGCFMIGLPGETKETIEQTFQFAKKLNPDMAFFQQAVPFPGTEFYNWCKQNGYLVTEDFDKWLDSNGQLDFLVSYPELSREELRKIRDNLMLKFYFSPKHIWQTITHNLSFDEMRRVFNAAKDYISFLIKSRVKK